MQSILPREFCQFHGAVRGGEACFSAGRGEHPWSSMQQMEEEKTWRFLGASLSRLEQTTSMEECNFVSDFVSDSW